MDFLEHNKLLPPPVPAFEIRAVLIIIGTNDAIYLIESSFPGSLPRAVEDTALEPLISKRTLDIHHGKHHAKYVTVTNEMIKGTDLENASLEEIVKAAKGRKREDEVLRKQEVERHASYKLARVLRCHVAWIPRNHFIPFLS